ncbi:hypothetical protein CONLIGDRAFT_649784 [Coniochaeta ligniaria NRRL 30616]|uniref:Uncharacterized protein n=1 Tax=Coniochaeta ligniaria NRRL 30616 TaxID=1408157 RepID=A0A1J7I753_9PEZI|nr:hypothetical protein CONLIGDRAFT_649784 [Coniochaeta ligniaria NRRL 30616]
MPPTMSKPVIEGTAEASPEAKADAFMKLLAAKGVDVSDQGNVSLNHNAAAAEAFATLTPAEQKRANIQIRVAENLVTALENTCNAALLLVHRCLHELTQIPPAASQHHKTTPSDLAALKATVDRYIAADRATSAAFQRYMLFELRELQSGSSAALFEADPRVVAFRGRVSHVYHHKTPTEERLAGGLTVLRDRARMQGKARDVVRDMLVRSDNPDSMRRARETALEALREVKSGQKKGLDGE